MNANKYDDLADLISQETEFEWDAIHVLALIKSRESFEDGIIDDPFVKEDELEEKYLDRYFITDSIQNALTS